MKGIDKVIVVNCLFIVNQKYKILLEFSVLTLNLSHGERVLSEFFYSK